MVLCGPGWAAGQASIEHREHAASHAGDAPGPFMRGPGPKAPARERGLRNVREQPRPLGVGQRGFIGGRAADDGKRKCAAVGGAPQERKEYLMELRDGHHDCTDYIWALRSCQPQAFAESSTKIAQIWWLSPLPLCHHFL